MVLHLLKLAWRRKGASALLGIEILFSFLVTFAVAALGSSLVRAWREPLGFDPRPVWDVALRFRGSDDDYTPEQAQTFAAVLAAARAVPGVVAAAGVQIAPYQFGEMNGRSEVNGRHLEVELDEMTDDAAEVLGLDVVAGRWFERSDDALAWDPVVVDRDTAALAWPGESALGKVWREGRDGGREARVVGVVGELRRGGELSSDRPIVLTRLRTDGSTRPAGHLLVRVAPGSGLALEERLVRELERAAPAWSFTAQPLLDARRESFRMRLVPLAGAAVVAAFLLLMVVLGLTGVVWQNVTQRTREIGLRRAIGASGVDVHRQLLSELLITAGAAIALGAAAVAQLPLVAGDLVAVPTIVLGVAVAALLVFAVTALAGFYPTLLASRVQPAEALRWE